MKASLHVALDGMTIDATADTAEAVSAMLQFSGAILRSVLTSGQPAIDVPSAPSRELPAKAAPAVKKRKWVRRPPSERSTLPPATDGDSKTWDQVQARRDALFALIKTGPKTFSELRMKYDEPGLKGDEKVMALRNALQVMRKREKRIDRAGQNWVVRE